MRVSGLTLRLAVSFATLLCCCIAVSLAEEPAIAENATSTPSDREVLVGKWRKLEKDMKMTIESVVRRAMPTLVRFITSANIEPQCTGALLTTVTSLLNMKSWAFEMLDAIGKPQPGILMGTITSLGSYDECINIEVKDDYRKEITKFTGKFCSVTIKPPLPNKPKYYNLHHLIKEFDNFTHHESIITKVQQLAGIMFDVPLRFGVCIPSKCSREDLHELVQKLADQVSLETEVSTCEVKHEVEWTTTQVVIGCMFLFIVFINLLSTFFDLIYSKFFVDRKALKKPERPLPVKIFCTFSLYKSFPTLFTCSSNLEPKFLHGMRAVSLGWIVLGCVFLFLNTSMLSQAIYAKEYADTWWIQFILNGTLGIETLLFTTAYLLGHVAKTRKNETGNVLFYVKLIVTKILRLLPILLLVIGMAIMLPLTTSGPLWREVALPYEENCMNYWWSNILFINNFLFDPNTRCLYNSWFLSCEMQLIIIGILFIATLSNVRRRISLTIAAFLVFTSIIITGVVTAYFDYPPTILFSQIDFSTRNYFENIIQQKPFSHLSTLIIGLLAGYYFTRLPKINVKVIYQWIGWCLTFICLSCVVFGIFEWNRREKVDTLLSTLYSCLYRPAWALCLSWIAFTCSNGNAKTISFILEWAGWIPLSRISYFFFLIYPLYQDMVFAQGRELVQVSLYLALFLFSGVFVLGGLTSLLCSLLVQQPIQAITKLFLCPVKSVDLMAVKIASERSTLPSYDRSMSVTSEISLVSNISMPELPAAGSMQKRDSCIPLSLNME